jgi:hypothetical protein
MVDEEGRRVRRKHMSQAKDLGSSQRWKGVTGQAAVSNPLPYIAPFSEIGIAGPGTKEDRWISVVSARPSLHIRNKIGDMPRNKPEVECADSSPQIIILRRIAPLPPCLGRYRYTPVGPSLC